MENTDPAFTSGIKATELQVLICTYGREGLQRVATAAHPAVAGVEYIVCWQMRPEETDHTAPQVLDRPDFKIISTLTKGLSVNRNIAISRASAPILLISDDDVDYTEEWLRTVIDAFRLHKDLDILTFRYVSASHQKHYPSHSFDLASPEKGYFTTSFEIALRRKAIQGKVWFNENFGIGAMFPSGEEDVFIRDCISAGLKGIFIPEIIARHDGTTTSDRNLMLPSRPQTKGAVFLLLHPVSWPLRMVVHALREIPLWRKGIVPSPLSYCRNWLKGVGMARKHGVFPTPDLSLQYPNHG